MRALFVFHKMLGIFSHNFFDNILNLYPWWTPCLLHSIITMRILSWGKLVRFLLKKTCIASIMCVAVRTKILESSATASANEKSYWAENSALEICSNCNQNWSGTYWAIVYLRRDHVVSKCLSEQNQEKMNIYTLDVKAGLLKYKGSCCFEHTVLMNSIDFL